MNQTPESKTRSSWSKCGDGKGRCSQIYASHRISVSKQDNDSRRISFLSDDNAPYKSFSIPRDDSTESRAELPLATEDTSATPHDRVDSFPSALFGSRQTSADLGDCGTRLLNMVRAHSQQTRERQQAQKLELPSEDSDDEVMSELCPHGWNRTTERSGSISRSRASRISSKRDMDIPSLIAFNASLPSKLLAAATHKDLPAFQRAKSPEQEERPRWSIRRSVCPVCSQKWKDRSSINIIKSSGLKRNLSSEFSSVIAPARLRTYASKEYVPRPTVTAVSEESGTFRSAGAAWQLKRARRFRTPNLGPPPQTEAPEATAPLARKDLDVRVHRFLTNLQQDS